MIVKVEITLSNNPTQKHKKLMYQSAKELTNDDNSIVISQHKKKNIIIAEFTMKNAKQIDVVDKIGDEFSDYMEDYLDSSISFPKRKPSK